MKRRQPRYTRNDTLIPYTTHFRSKNGNLKSIRWSECGLSGSIVIPSFTRLKSICIESNEKLKKVTIMDNKYLEEINCHGGEFGCGYRRVAKLRSEEHTSELQSLMRISYAVFCLKKKNK